MKEELLQNLQQRIREISYNSLRRVYPLQLQEWSKATDKELKLFIEELLEERLIACKYDFQCSCGNNCTAYHERIKDNFYRCDECEETYNFNEIITRSTLLYELDKYEILNYNEELIDFKEIEKNTINVIRIPLGQERKNMEIFIGSSSEATDFMENIAVMLEGMDVSPLPWNATGKDIFVPGVNTIDALINITRRARAAIFIFSADDKMWNSETALDAQCSVRDNVLFEYGLFVGALGKENVCFIVKRNKDENGMLQPLKEISDLKGVTYIDGDLGEFTMKSKLKDWVKQLK